LARIRLKQIIDCLKVLVQEPAESQSPLLWPAGGQKQAMNKRTVIIDDDVSGRQSLRKALQGAGYAVALAAGGQEDAICIESQEFEIMLLDLNLPQLKAPGDLRAGREHGLYLQRVLQPEELAVGALLLVAHAVLRSMNGP
jgi:CheY-like chemotaxis protein